MKKEYIGLIVVLLLVISVLSTFILYNQIPYMTGKEIVLDTQPVDPFAPFRGQYMTINYDISSLQTNKSFNTGDTVYVKLKKEENSKVWNADGVFKREPEGTFIKGEIKRKREDRISVEYGIEHFFFERNADVPTRNITVKVKVTGEGRAKLVELLQHGKPINISYEPANIKR